MCEGRVKESYEFKWKNDSYKDRMRDGPKGNEKEIEKEEDNETGR